ncbi:hypothetical protein B0T14DRAFT_567949 [Immersiella caudata]|uniref:Uncharacterized protein n=1 Tax=Immersiella caudata TaxID=314043 RepID=A0AA40BWK3_9PEZI|nr:hypothetical protein B0T14DRAFT_567949 [Immersiella caudata]
MGSVYFLEAVIDGKSGHSWLRFPADTTPPEIYAILRHAVRKQAGNASTFDPCLRHDTHQRSKDRQFRALCVWSAPEADTPFEFDVEGQKQFQLAFDPSSDVLCLTFRLAQDKDSTSGFQFTDTASAVTTNGGKWVETELDARSETSADASLPGLRASSRTLRAHPSRSASATASRTLLRQRSVSIHRKSPSLAASSRGPSEGANGIAWSNSNSVRPSDMGTSLADLLGDLHHIAIRWDPAVFSSYECTQCLHPHNANPSAADEMDEEDDNNKIPSICWRGGHDPSPTHDFIPVVPRDVLEYWPDQFPHLERVSLIVEGITQSGLARMAPGAEIFLGVLEQFLVVNESTLDKRWSTPATFAKEMEKNFAEIGQQCGINKPPPRCSVLARIG